MGELQQNIPRIYTAIAEWGACMVYFSVLEKRYSGFRWKALCLGALALQIIWMMLTGEFPVVLWIPSMIAAAGIMFFFLHTGAKISFTTAGYYCARAFLLAELTASFEWQLHYYFFSRHGYSNRWLQIVLFLICYSVVLGVAWILEKRLLKEYAAEISGRELCSAIAIVIAAFIFSNLSFIYTGSPFTNRFAEDIFFTRTLVDLGGISILFAFQSRICELHMNRELTAIDTVLKSQYDHYRHYQESIDVINMKYHDLKHQIAALKAENDPEKKAEWIDAMEQEINGQNLGFKTGNSVLDTIVNGKVLYCQKNGIKITCVADGELLNFMHVTDICTIFGNALDNAIESVIMLQNPEHRMIHLKVTSKRNFLIIQVENYCKETVVIKNGYPVTTKNDKENHGFGVKSICHTVNKYGGNVQFGVDNHWFELKIMIPKKLEN